MKTVLSLELQSRFKKIIKTDRKLSEKIYKQLKLFTQDPKHPSLRVHKLSGELKNLWSISITQKIRMIYLVEGDVAIFTKLGAHNEIYRN